MKNETTVRGVPVSNPQKILFTAPAVTKLEVVRYYAAVSRRMLPYLSGRLLSIVRCPKGVCEACFYKKHPGPGSKGILTHPVKNTAGEEEEYFYLNSSAGLLWEAQMGTLEFHTWGSKAQALEHPDQLVFDLDPDEGLPLAKLRQGVRDLKQVLDELGLRSFLKASGGKGYHVVVPLAPAQSWDAFHAFARRVAEYMERRWPKRYTSNVRKEQRKGRIFIDWIRNGRGATSIAPYSLRAREGASVAMPLRWEELSRVAPNAITMQKALTRLKQPNPWQGYFQVQKTQRLK